MAAIQGHITNNRGKEQSPIAHHTMEAMIRTWTGGLTLTVTKDDRFELRCGPHDEPDRNLLLVGTFDDGLVHIEKVSTMISGEPEP